MYTIGKMIFYFSLHSLKNSWQRKDFFIYICYFLLPVLSLTKALKLKLYKISLIITYFFVVRLLYIFYNCTELPLLVGYLYSWIFKVNNWYILSITAQNFFTLQLDLTTLNVWGALNISIHFNYLYLNSQKYFCIVC